MKVTAIVGVSGLRPHARSGLKREFLMQEDFESKKM
jgi:hypothetical protein